MNKCDNQLDKSQENQKWTFEYLRIDVKKKITGRTIPLVDDVISGGRRKTKRPREYIHDIHLHMNVHKN
jgi:pyrimidine operon attenuation protein/uracil phosphoribosyltransferase